MVSVALGCAVGGFGNDCFTVSIESEFNKIVTPFITTLTKANFPKALLDVNRVHIP